MGDLSRDFSRAEFACRDGCGADAVSPHLVALLQQMRDSIGRPIGIRSGCRCVAWNAHEGGKRDSAHLAVPRAERRAPGDEMCEAADLAAPTSAERFEILAAAQIAGAKRIGIGKDFVHVDVDPDKDQGVVWLY